MNDRSLDPHPICAHGYRIYERCLKCEQAMKEGKHGGFERAIEPPTSNEGVDRLIQTVNARMPNSVTPATRIQIHPAEWTELVREILELRAQTQKGNLLNALAAKQAKIDALMLEFCPGEMSAEQRAEWAANQRRSDETTTRPSSPQYEELITGLREVCTCVGENKADEDNPLCLFCDARLQIEAQQRTIDLLTADRRAVKSTDEYHGIGCAVHAGGQCNCAAEKSTAGNTYQQRVFAWAVECFGTADATDRPMRSVRFLEEALELVQSCGCSKSSALEVINYVYGRPAGEVQQETGGTLVSLAVLCEAFGIQMHTCGENELARVLQIIPKIRERHGAKPRFDGASEKSSTVRDSIAPNKYCSKCERFFWLDQFDGHNCVPPVKAAAPLVPPGRLCNTHGNWNCSECGPTVNGPEKP